VYSLSFPSMAGSWRGDQESVFQVPRPSFERRFGFTDFFGRIPEIPAPPVPVPMLYFLRSADVLPPSQNVGFTVSLCPLSTSRWSSRGEVFLVNRFFPRLPVRLLSSSPMSFPFNVNSRWFDQFSASSTPVPLFGTHLAFLLSMLWGSLPSCLDSPQFLARSKRIFVLPFSSSGTLTGIGCSLFFSSLFLFT